MRVIWQTPWPGRFLAMTFLPWRTVPGSAVEVLLEQVHQVEKLGAAKFVGARVRREEPRMGPNPAGEKQHPRMRGIPRRIQRLPGLLHPGTACRSGIPDNQSRSRYGDLLAAAFLQ